MTEKVIWQDKKHFMWFPWSFTRYKLTENRLFIEAGLFTTHYDETQLYRIRDIKLIRKLRHKIFRTGDIQLITTEQTQPTIVLKNIKLSFDVKEMLSQLVEEARRRNLVREVSGGLSGFDLEDADSDGIPDVFQ
ncbi:MAG: PH domain-containing protein [Saccharofermentanales bacterium]